MGDTRLTQSQASRLLLNRLPTMAGTSGYSGWTGSQIRGLLRQWGVQRRRRGAVLQRMITNGELVRRELEEPREVDGRLVTYVYDLPEEGP